MASPAVDEILRKHPELSLAEAQWMAGEMLAPFEVLCDLDDEAVSDEPAD